MNHRCRKPGFDIIEASPDKAQLTAHRGEALVARAYAHFMLVTFFAKAYDPATAASDPVYLCDSARKKNPVHTSAKLWPLFMK